MIEPINDSMWTDILRLQQAGYSEVEPESLAVLKSKWLNSPQCCFVYFHNARIVAYLLAHSWNDLSPPPLFQTLPDNPAGDILFIHDLVVDNQARHLGIGRALIEHLLQSVSRETYSVTRLVAVQQSVAFWSRLGFATINDYPLDQTYGPEAVLMQQRL